MKQPGISGKKFTRHHQQFLMRAQELLTDQTIEGVARPWQAFDESDEILKNMKRMEAETKAMTEIAKAEQAQMGEAIDTFNRMLDDGEDPAAALGF